MNLDNYKISLTEKKLKNIRRSTKKKLIENINDVYRLYKMLILNLFVYQRNKRKTKFVNNLYELLL